MKTKLVMIILLIILLGSIMIVYGFDVNKSDPSIKTNQQLNGKLEIIEIKNPSTNGGLNEEWILIKNNTKTEIDMDKYVLCSKTKTISKRDGKDAYIFKGFILPAGGEVKIHTGEGENTNTDLFLWQRRQLWNNKSDVAYLCQVLNEYTY